MRGSRTQSVRAGCQREMRDESHTVSQPSQCRDEVRRSVRCTAHRTLQRGARARSATDLTRVRQSPAPPDPRRAGPGRRKTQEVPRTWAMAGRVRSHAAFARRTDELAARHLLPPRGVARSRRSTCSPIRAAPSWRSSIASASALVPFEHVRPFLWLALHHEHQAQRSAILRDPIATTLGLSTDGVAHKTGADAALRTDLRVPIDDTPVIASLRIGAIALPSRLRRACSM